jgi:predicted N-acetyltransferase YhbS
MNHSITKAKELGFAAIIVFGDPLYYHRFGFKNAQEYRITTRDGQNFDPFMLCALDEEKMKSIEGAFFEADAFTVDADELAEFDKRFPHREKERQK